MSIGIAKVYNGFRNSKREIGTHFSEKDFKLLYTNSKLSCLDILEKYFHCSVCFNIDLEYIISYNGRKINLERTDCVIEFTDQILKIISGMYVGSLEYEIFNKVNN
jgi:hypothetical protein|tara:strand:- start:1355 stop:1672 length:318 start_codon:yes stop_codon:yes gene_type:complete